MTAACVTLSEPDKSVSDGDWAAAVAALLGGNPPQESADSKPAETPPAAEEEAKPDYSWRRKAASRRLHRSCGTGNEPAEDFRPVFTPPRDQIDLPLFELSAADFVGRNDHGAAARGRWERVAILAACLFAAVLAILSIAAVLRSGGVAEGQSDSPAALSAMDALTWVEVQQDHSRVPEAREAVEAFFRASSPKEKARLVRGGEKMLPAMRRYYALHPDEPEGVRLASDVEFGNDSRGNFLFVRGTDPTGGDIEILVEDTDAGMKLDWRFLTGAGETEWVEWTARQPCCLVSMRVEAVLDDYYSGQFSDEDEWVCLRIMDAAHTSSVWAYISRNSDDGLTIQRELDDRPDPVRLIGLFEFPANIPKGSQTAPQVYLRSVAQQGWMDRASPADDSSPLASLKP